MIFVFLLLTYFIKYDNLSIASMLLQNGIILFLFMAEWYSILYMYHIFFIHLLLINILGCFHVLAIVNSAAINIGVHVSFWIRVLAGYIPRG